MTRFNNHGPSGERYRPKILTPSMKMKPFSGEAEKDFEERRRNRRALELMDAYSKAVTVQIEAGEEVEPKVMTYEMARKIIDETEAEVENEL